MREILYSLLSMNTDIIAKIPAARIKPLGGLETPPQLPWIGFKLLPLDRGIGPVNVQNAEVWVYDNPGSYELIDQVGRLVRAALLNAPPRSFLGSDGKLLWLNAVEFVTESGDLFDDQWRAAVRNQGFRLTGSGI